MCLIGQRRRSKVFVCSRFSLSSTTDPRRAQDLHLPFPLLFHGRCHSNLPAIPFNQHGYRRVGPVPRCNSKTKCRRKSLWRRWRTKLPRLLQPRYSCHQGRWHGVYCLAGRLAQGIAPREVLPYVPPLCHCPDSATTATLSIIVLFSSLCILRTPSVL